MKNREYIVFEGTRDSTEQRIHESCECLWVLCSSFVFIQPIIGWIYLQHTAAYGCAFARWTFFYCLPLGKITPRNFLCLWSKIIRNSSSAHHNFYLFSFKKRPNLSLYDEYSRTLIWFFKDSKFAYKTTKFYPKWYVLNFGQNHELQYLEEIAM